MSRSAPIDSWRHENVGRLLNNTIRRFESRVLQLMWESGHKEARIAHVNLTRSLDRTGTRAVELARRAAMTKQAMAELIDQCVELKLVERRPDPTDGRARIVVFTRRGLKWLAAFRSAVVTAESELRQEVGADLYVSLKEALHRYGSDFDSLTRGSNKARAMARRPSS